MVAPSIITSFDAYVLPNSKKALVLRYGPGTSYGKITSMPQESFIHVTGTNSDGSWYYVTFNGYNGWCSAEFVSTSSSYQYEYGDYGYTMAVLPKDGLFLRTGPSTSYAKILKMDQYSTVTVLGLSDDGSWSYVSYYGTEGWCSSDFLAMD